MATPLRPLVVFFTLAGLACSVLAAGMASVVVLPTEAQIDGILGNRVDRPGAVAAVIRDGKVAVARATGLANLEDRAPFTVGTRSNLGSTSKQFTAYAIVQLAAAGKLSLDDDVRRFIPELPAFEQTVTVRHLLTHTSGYRELFQMVLLGGRSLEDRLDRSEVIEVVRRQGKLQTSPGNEWNYNNTGYGLLALIVERVTAKPFPEALRGQIFASLGLAHTAVRSSPEEKLSDAAAGYVFVDGHFRAARDLSAALGAGAIYSTVDDVARWMGNFCAEASGGEKFFAEMATPRILTGYGETRYGYGLYIDRWNGMKRIYHHGDDVAHHAAFFYFPESAAGVVVLTNDAGFDAVDAANRIAEIVFAAQVAEARKQAALEKATTVFDPARLDAFVGQYGSAVNPGLIYGFGREGDRLWVEVAGERMKLSPLSPTRFRVDGQSVELEFEVHEKDPVEVVTVFNWGADKAHRVTGSGAPEKPRDLTVYAGRYESGELPTFYILEVDGDRLAVRHPQFPEPVHLKPVVGERFSGDDPVSSVVFERDAQGHVTGFRAGNASGREYIRFLRVP